jgi:6-phosphogluconolactonase (cycloisomerase 2 family)
MKVQRTTALAFAFVCAATLISHAADSSRQQVQAPGSSPIYLVANQDLGFPDPSFAGVYQAQGTQLTFNNALQTGGEGVQGGFFGTNKIASVPSLTAPCIYLSNGGTNNIATVALPSFEFVDTFSGADTDDGTENGIGLAANSNYLYASYTTSATIAAFALNPGCGLTFLGSIPAVGLQGGPVSGMAVNASMLVVAYGDGSIQSFNVTGGIPVPNNDLQNSNGYGGHAVVSPKFAPTLPSAVDITQDGRFAIFGDISAVTTIEVASLASGTLGKTKVYTVGTGIDAGNIRLSPDETMLFIANSEGGTVTAAFFNKNTGEVTRGCASATLKDFNSRPWLGNVVTRDTEGTGGVLYVAEYGRDHLEINHGLASLVGILTITSNGSSCSLTETDTSPLDLSTPGVLSLGVYPPRPF